LYLKNNIIIIILGLQTNVSPLVPGFLVLGQDQDIPGGLFEEDSAFCGQITQVDIFTSSLNSETISQIANCRSEIKGDLIPWDVDDWETYGEVEFR